MNSIKIEEEIFTKVLQCDSPEEREACLDKQCGPNLDLRQRIQQLIWEYERPHEIFLNPAAAVERLVDHGMPSRFGDFEIIAELGRGGMGVVYEAKQRSLNRRVALKVLSSNLRLSPLAAARFQREAEAAARLHHTNIVRVYYTGTENHVPYYVMELIQGPSLDRVITLQRQKAHVELDCDALNEERFKSTAANMNQSTPSGLPHEVIGSSGSETFVEPAGFGEGASYCKNVARLMADVADALVHGHRHGVVHRDIKPSNLLLAPDGKLAISDFGLARLLEQPGVTTTGELLGTPLYMSPELLSASGDKADHRTDIYSFGATLYELLTLRPPFQGERRDQILMQVIQENPVAPRIHNPAIPRDLETACLKAMEKDPTHRYQSAADLSDDLRRFVSGHTILVRCVGPITRVIRWSRRNRLAASLASLLICSLFLSALVTTWQAKRNRAANEQRYSSLKEKVNLLLRKGHTFDALELIIESDEFGDRLRADLYQKFGQPTQVTSEPAGAEILVRPARSNSRKWLSLGTTPVTVPLEFERRWHWRAICPGYEDAFWLTDYHTLETWHITMSTKPGMVPIPATNHAVGTNQCRITWLMGKQLPVLAEFHIDRFEVTNGEFAKFIDEGGYTDGRFWRETLGDGWQEVVRREFLDLTNKPGPKFWRNGNYPRDEANYPVIGVSWCEAMAYVQWAEKRLPTIYHWLHAAGFNGGTDDIELTWHSNIGNKLEYPRASKGQDDDLSVNTKRVFDLSGNVKEWCINEESKGSFYTLGGSFSDKTDATLLPSSFKANERLRNVGFRCATYDADAEITDAAPVHYRSTEILKEPNIKQYGKLFEYDDSLPFNASMPVKIDWSGIPMEGWRYDPAISWKAGEVRNAPIEDSDIRRFEIDAVYGGEKIPCYVALPDERHYQPPYQTVLVFSGRNADAVSNNGLTYLMDGNARSLLESGRALVHPIYWGTYERFSNDYRSCFPLPEEAQAFTSSIVKIAKEFSRVVDFLVEGKREVNSNNTLSQLIDSDNLAYYGMGLGVSIGPLLLVTDEMRTGEKRIKSSIFLYGGWVHAWSPPEVDQLNYVPWLTTPTLLMNNSGHLFFPVDQSQRPMFEAIPLIEDDTKKHVIVPPVRIGISRQVFQRHAPAWLDRWLGPVQMRNHANQN